MPVFSFAQDPGIRDTVRIECDSLIVGQSRPVTITVVNDEIVDLISLGFIFRSINNGYALFDSVEFVNRMADPSVMNVRWIIPKSNDGIPPDSLLISCYQLLGNRLAAGNTSIAKVYMTGVSVGSMSFDSIYFPPGSPFIFILPGNAYFPPELISDTIPVVEGSMAPELTIGDGVFVGQANSNFFFDVETNSPFGNAVGVILESFNKYDNFLIQPANPPSFTYNSAQGKYEFYWTSADSDIGIWQAVVTVCDSIGSCTSAETMIQVVENESYIIAFQETISPGFNYPTALSCGNFDADLYPEVASSGLGYLGTAFFSVYDNNGAGIFTEVFNQTNPLSHRRGLEAAYLNTDEILDIVQFYQESSLNPMEILAFAGNGDNTFSTPVASELHPDWALFAAVGKYNNDAYLDYAIGGRNVFRIYAGSANLEFTLLSEINVADSIMTFTSTDFNADGYDDVAVGFRQGLKVYLGADYGVFTLAGSYSQEFGSVNIEVTNEGADFNGDNYFDLCVATPSVGDTGSQLMVYLGNGDGSFQQIITRSIYGHTVANAPSDFNNDGLIDIAFLNSSGKYLGILFGDGDGSFTNELRFDVPILDPARLICTDADLDGDVDIIVNASRLPIASYLVLFENQTNPDGFNSRAVGIYGEDNAQLELVSASGKVLNRVANSMPSANYYRRNLNLNDKLDDYADLNLVENGDYVLTVRPDPSQPAGTPFTVEFSIDGKLYRLAKDVSMAQEKYEFGVCLAPSLTVSPRPGNFTYADPPVFMWPDKATTQFQLSSDLGFNSILIDTTVNSSLYQPISALDVLDTTTYYWRIRPIGTNEFSPVYVFNLMPASPACGDIDGVAGPINFLDLVFMA
ncbi:MAG TPA: VCBS repeat-containing protein, partial [candidate division Zixibacteria bacterium]|nr:VCBS repeat-containing protein [candidate division Zixibacteria bacterium]